MSFREIKWGIILKVLWLTTTLSIWQMGLGSCLIQPDCDLARRSIWPLLWLFSFPGGFILALINDLFVSFGFALDTSIPVEYAGLGLGAILVGYIQWFHVFPALLRKKDFVVLLLSPSARSLPGYKKPRSSSFEFDTSLVAPFDDIGRTPLERVIVADDRSSTDAS
jgi:hypothetical protein